jgi:hypothetical protein
VGELGEAGDERGVGEFLVGVLFGCSEKSWLAGPMRIDAAPRSPVGRRTGMSTVAEDCLPASAWA